MLDRRHFLQTSSLLGVGSLLPAVTPAGTAAASAGGRLHCAVVDTRYGPCRQFARRLEQEGVPVFVTEGNLTDVWYRHLQPLWRTAPAAVAGFTAFASLFCLERLAWNHELRVVYRGVHAAAGDRRLEHRIAAPPLLRQRLRFELDDHAWPGLLARALCGPRSAWDQAPPILSSVSETVLAGRVAQLPAGLPLYSWVIA